MSVGRAIKDLGPVALVAVAVALLSTLAGAWLDHIHQVDAETLAITTAQAAPTADNAQTLALPEWGVRAELPLAPELPLVSYSHLVGADAIGLSSADVAALGPDCRAEHYPLGLLARQAVGQPTPRPAAGVTSYFVASVGGYDYHYELAPTACIDTPTGQALVNRETGVIREALGSLAPATP